jgi:hypothetical protein
LAALSCSLYGCQRFARQSCPTADKAAAVLPSRESAETPSKPKPVAHRQWRDRWRLDDRKVVQRLSRPNGGNAADEKDPRKCCLRVRPRRSRGLRRWCFCGCSSRETSVVEAGSRHLGDVSKQSREAKRGATSSDGGRWPAWTRSTVILLAEGCSGRQRTKVQWMPLGDGVE